MTGLILSAPGSGAGKTTLTLGILRALRRRGINVRGAKSGPDYIDPRFHAAASGVECVNLDAWAMTPDRIRQLAGDDSATPTTLIIEGAMGLFDGAPPEGRGATADLAQILRLPVVLIVDAARMAQSVAPLVAGFAGHDPDVRIAGVILNHVGSPRHERMLRRALEPMGMPVLGAVYRAPDLGQPSRHLGLVQAQEHGDLEGYLDRVAEAAAAQIDLDALLALATELPGGGRAAAGAKAGLAPPAQTITIAQDRAFAFAYPHILADWRRAGAQVSFFSPLADEAAPMADMVFLPGGYPELYAAELAAADTFKASLRSAADRGAWVYGECGGYMSLGDTLIDAQGTPHAMAGLLPHVTSFAQRKLHLGYRQITASHGPFVGGFGAHEFHYATTVENRAPALFRAQDAEGNDLPDMGGLIGPVCGSFSHLIDAAP